MEEDKAKLMQINGLKWLREMEIVDDPYLLSNVKLNLYSVSRFIKDVEILLSKNHKAVLVYLKVGKVAQYFYGNYILDESLETLKSFIPNYSFRVVFDKKVFDKSLELVQKALKEGKSV